MSVPRYVRDSTITALNLNERDGYDIVKTLFQELKPRDTEFTAGTRLIGGCREQLSEHGIKLLSERLRRSG